MTFQIPSWAEELRRAYTSSSASQFILYGNIFDVVPHLGPDKKLQYTSLQSFLENVMLENFDMVLAYDRGRGLRIVKADKKWFSVENAESPLLPLGASFLNPVQALAHIDQQILRILNLEQIRKKE